MVNTGSEQGKKRKRQDSTKELENDDIKEAVPKQKKKTKLGGQVMHDSKDTDEPNTKQSTKDTVLAKKDEKRSTSQKSGKECSKRVKLDRWVTVQHNSNSNRPKRSIRVSRSKFSKTNSVELNVELTINLIRSVNFLSSEVRRLTWA